MKPFKKYTQAICLLLTVLLLIHPELSIEALSLCPPSLDSLSVSATPTDSVSDGDHTAQCCVITGYENMDSLTNLPELRLVQRTSPYNTNDLLEHVFPFYRINAHIQYPDGSTETVPLRVNWDCFGYDAFRVDVTTPGSYTEIGRIQLPNEQTVFKEGVPSELTIPVTVYVPDSPIEITYIQELSEDFLFYSSYALEQYHDVSEITNLLRTTWVCEDANGHEYECPVVLNTSLVNSDTPGIYEITGTFLPPLHCAFPEELEVPSFTLGISVQTFGNPRLDCMQPTSWGLYFPWIATGMDLDSMKVWLSENGGQWRELNQYDEVYLTESDLSLDTHYLTEGSSYRLQVDYEGGQTGIASFDYGEGVFHFKSYIEGDRDGGDTNGYPPSVLPTPTPTISPTATPTPAPTIAPTAVPTQVPTPVPSPEPTIAPTTVPTQEPTIAPTTVPTQVPTAVPSETPVANPTAVPTLAPTEAPVVMPTVAPTLAPTAAPAMTPTPVPTVSPTATPIPPSLRAEPYLLGSEVLQMVDNAGCARFSNQEILLSLPAGTIEELKLEDTEQILVTLKSIDKYNFFLDIKRNGEPITILGNMQVTLPYAPKDASSQLVLVDSNGNELTRGNLSESQGLITFTLNQTGVFSIQEHIGTALLPPDETVTQQFPWSVVITASLVLVFAVVLFILYRKRGK